MSIFITNTVTKKILEKIIHETFSNFGVIASSSLLDSLKLLGFYYATNAGISITIEDLKTPNLKKDCLEEANEKVSNISQKWVEGIVSDTERFQTILESWNMAGESLKDRIVEYFEDYNPTNNLYIMAFSGARGNMTQVRQLIGMRGLMSDQEGNIIDLPIQSNFREGLTSLDYIISSYGARKGIVDTALKTADSGYLTRRLIYVAQDIIIKEIDCQANNGLKIILEENNNFINLIGKTLISHSNNNKVIITDNILKNFLKNDVKEITIRSPLTCKSTSTICQYCYGWDLARNELICLGEAVGITAAQSIGEPGTQLTMRTFHTGGVFTSEIAKQILAPLSGKLVFPPELKIQPYRTPTGKVLYKLNQAISVPILNWEEKQIEISLAKGSYLAINKSQFLKKGDLIAEYADKVFNSGKMKLKPIYSYISGEIIFQKLLIRKCILENEPSLKIIQRNGSLWIASGKVFKMPKEANYKFPYELKKYKSFANIKLISPQEGYIYMQGSQIIIQNKEKKIIIDFPDIEKINDCLFKFVPLFKNYQWIDAHTNIALMEIFSTNTGKIHSVKKKEVRYSQSLFLITDSDLWTIYSDQVNNYKISPNPFLKVKSNSDFTTTAKFAKSGILFKKDGLKMTFQNAIPIYLTEGGYLHVDKGQFIYRKNLIAKLINFAQQTEDIVQGLPKVDDIVEARSPKNTSFLSNLPGIIHDPKTFYHIKRAKIAKKNKISILHFIHRKSKYPKKKKSDLLKKKKKLRQKILISHFKNNSFDNLFSFDNKLWHGIYLPLGFIPDENPKTHKIIFRPIEASRDITKGEYLMIGIKIVSKSWQTKKYLLKKRPHLIKKIEKLPIYKYVNSHRIFIKKIRSIDTVYQNRQKNYIIEMEKGKFLYLELFNPINVYRVPIENRLVFSPGNLVDVGEGITEGKINFHNLLNVLNNYYIELDGYIKGPMRSLHKFQLIVINSIQAIYESQGVKISNTHIELIVRQLTSKGIIKDPGETPFLQGEIYSLSFLKEVHAALEENSNLKYHPIFQSSTNISLNKSGFLAAAGFQETRRVLTKAALEGSKDWLKGLKESVITGRLIPAGTAFLNYKNYLDNVYFYKKKTKKEL
jgi:hypothetical protein